MKRHSGPLLIPSLLLALLLCIIGYTSAAGSPRFAPAGFAAKVKYDPRLVTQQATLTIPFADETDQDGYLNVQKGTMAITGGSIDGDFTLDASGLDVHFPRACYDAKANAFGGPATVSGGGLPCQLAASSVTFDATGVQSMAGIRRLEDFTVGGVVFEPREAAWKNGALTFKGVLLTGPHPQVRVTATGDALSLSGPPAPATFAVNNCPVTVTKIELLDGKLWASGTYRATAGAVNFTRKRLTERGIDGVRPTPVPRTKKPADLSPWIPGAHPPGKKSVGLFAPPALTLAAPSPSGSLTRYTLATPLSRLASLASRSGRRVDLLGLAQRCTLANALTRIDPGRYLAARTADNTVPMPGTATYDPVGPTPGALSMVMTAGTVTADGSIPSGFIELFSPLERVYAVNPALTSDGLADLSKGNLFWQHQYSSVTVYFPPGVKSVYPAKLKNGDLGLTKVTCFHSDEKYMLTSGFDGSDKSIEVFGVEAAAMSVMADGAEINYILSAGIDKEIELFSIGPIGMFFSLDDVVNVNLAQLPNNTSGFLIDANVQSPTLALRLTDHINFYLIRGSTKYFHFYLQYASSGFFQVNTRLPVEIEVAKGITIENPGVDFFYIPKSGAAPLKLGGDIKGDLGIGKFIVIEDADLGFFYHNDGDWGTGISGSLALYIWRITISDIADFYGEFNFGKGLYSLVLNSEYIDIGLLKISSVGVAMQINDAAFNSDSWFVDVFAQLKIRLIVKTIKTSLNVYGYMDGSVRVQIGGGPIPPGPTPPDPDGPVTWDADLAAYGLIFKGHFEIEKTKDGELGSPSVQTDPHGAVAASDGAGSSATVQNLTVPRLDGNVDVSVSPPPLVAGATLTGDYAFTVVSAVYGDTLTLSAAGATLTVGADGTASSSPIAVNIGHSDNSTTTGSLFLSVTQTDQGGRLEAKITYSDSDDKKDGKVEIFYPAWQQEKP